MTSEQTQPIQQIHQGKAVTDQSTISFSNLMFCNHITPIFDYLNRDKKNNKLYFEQYGKIGENQKFDPILKTLSDNWAKEYSVLKQQDPKDRDKDAYFKNLLRTFKKEFFYILLLRLFTMGIEFAGVHKSHEFFSYLESDEDLTKVLPLTQDSTYSASLVYYKTIYRGYYILATIMFLEWPKSVVNRWFEKQNNQWGGKVNYAQETMLHQKYMRTSSATNKTISDGKFQMIVFGTTSTQDILIMQILEFIRAICVICFCTYQLYERVGLSFLLLPAIVYLKMQFAILTRPWRESGWRAQEKVQNKRKNELDMVLKNIKTVKLYSWQDFFKTKITDWRNEENRLRYISTFKNWACDLVQRTLSEIERPLVIISAMYFGKEVSMASIFTTLMMIDMLRGPMQLLPNFKEGIRNTRRCMTRTQKFHMIDEIQQDLIETTGPQWSKPAIEMKGNYSWGLINMQADEDSDDEELRLKQQSTAEESTHKLSTRIHLQNIDLKIEQGQFVCIIGGIGAGKTSLLNAITGEMVYVPEKHIADAGGMDSELTGKQFMDLQGQVLRAKVEDKPIVKRGSTSYVEQAPWIQHMTIRDNILFDEPMDETRYVQTVIACCLESDFEILNAGDLTEVGERGINLSGGQKARIALARAVYSNKDIVLMDDPMSALDAHVKKQVFKEVFQNMIKDKTRVLVTHAIEFLHLADKVIVVDQGQIIEQGTYQQVIKNPIVQHIVSIHDQNKTKENQIKSSVEEGNPQIDSQLPKADWECVAPPGCSYNKNPTEATRCQICLSNKPAVQNTEDQLILPVVHQKKAKTTQDIKVDYSVSFVKEKLTKFAKSKTTSTKLVKDDDNEKQVLDKEILYKAMRTIGGKLFWVMVFVTYLIQSLWKKYTDYKLKNLSSIQQKTDKEEDIGAHTNLLGFVLNTQGSMLLEIGRTFVTMYVGAKLSKDLFNLILKKIMKAPVNLYFDVTPMSKIAGYFSGDCDQCDKHLWRAIDFSTKTLVDSGSKILIACYFSPYLTIVAFVNSWLIWKLGDYVKDGKQETQRIMVLMRTRSESHLNQSADGMKVVRAFQRQEVSMAKSIEMINDERLARYFQRDCYDYQRQRSHYLSDFMYIAVGVACVNLKGSLQPIYLAMMFQYLQGLNDVVKEMISGYSEIEKNFFSLQKLLKLEDLPQEQDTINGHQTVSESYPSEGKIAFKDIELRYRPNCPLVLNKLNFEVQPGEKIGVVGRTGSGKSTLCLALSRIVELESGTIEIDGVDTSQVSIDHLRKLITVIPQEPVVFKETIKFNLDPSGLIGDQEIIDLLKQAGLDDLLTREPENKKAQKNEWLVTEKEEGGGKGIYFRLHDGGESLSQGEKQLMCICRAILRKNKIIVLDEATASIDIVTEQKIYKLIETAFKDSTMITVAHRLNTVLNCDRVLVMAEGRVVEYDNPQVLAQDKNSRLSYLLRDIEQE